jgi:hypothetical protein
MEGESLLRASSEVTGVGKAVDRSRLTVYHRSPSLKQVGTVQ